jgi:glutamyl-tRNA synthetase
MNGQYLSVTPAEELLAPVQRQLARIGVDAGSRDLRPLIDAAKARSRTIVMLAEQVAVRIDATRIVVDGKAEQLRRKMGTNFGAALALARDTLGSLAPSTWNADAILTAIKSAAESRGMKLGDAMQPIRVALTGATVSEPVNELLAVVGQEESLARLDAALAREPQGDPA